MSVVSARLGARLVVPLGLTETGSNGAPSDTDGERSHAIPLTRAVRQNTRLAGGIGPLTLLR
jgi:hypothetical protein